MARMTKKQATAIFMREYGDGLSMTDVIANREQWNYFTDSLCKNGYISQWQYNNWDNPNNKFFTYAKRKK